MSASRSRKPHTCKDCGREWLKPCELGDMHYPDGSWRTCPNWLKKLDEIGGMTREEADEAERVRNLYR